MNGQLRGICFFPRSLSYYPQIPENSAESKTFTFIQICKFITKEQVKWKCLKYFIVLLIILYEFANDKTLKNIW